MNQYIITEELVHEILNTLSGDDYKRVHEILSRSRPYNSQDSWTTDEIIEHEKLAVDAEREKLINHLILRKDSLEKNYPLGHDQRDGAQTRISEIDQTILAINAMKELRQKDGE